MKRIIPGLTFILWLGFILSAFYVVQKPFLLVVFTGLADTFWATGMWLLLFFCGFGIGEFLISKVLIISPDPIERVILGGGVGSGILGLVGFFLGVFGWTSPAILFGVMLGLLILLRNTYPVVLQNLREISQLVGNDLRTWPLVVRVVLIGTVLAAFLLALAPPGNGFDALAYHWVAPEKIIKEGGVFAYNHPQFWFPGLPEGLFLLAMGMKSVRATQLLHLTWAILSMLLVWYWAYKVWDKKVAQTTVVIILSMPSLYLLASWAYTDFTLVFFGLAGLYSVYKAFEIEPSNFQKGWIILSGIFGGMAMGVKYTSIPVPITILILIFIWSKNNPKLAIYHGFRMGLAALLIAAPWYIRNWVVLGNPFFPFLFGGLYWDHFRSAWFANAGSGIGWDLREIILLPLNAVLGHRDANYYDGRIGPLYLVLAPIVIYRLLKHQWGEETKAKTLLAITMFSLISFGGWTLGLLSLLLYGKPGCCTRY